MANTIKVIVDGQEFDAVEQQFEINNEAWNEYRLFDGGTIRVKVTVQKIFRIVDAQGKPLRTADGDPHIAVRHTTQVVTSD